MDPSRPLIAFDAMGVIFIDSDDVKSCLIPFLRERGVSAGDEEIIERYRSASRGATSARDFWSAWGMGQDHPAAQETFLRERLRFDPAFLEAAWSLRAWADLGLLSNDLGEWSSSLRAMHGIEGLLSLAVVSGDVGIRKPDPAIFALFIERARRPASRILFIDDRPSNLSAAAAAGMRTLRFLRTDVAAAPTGDAPLEGFVPDGTASDLRDIPGLARRILLRAPSP